MRLPQKLLAVIAGFVVGLCIGPVSVFAINARYVLRSNEEWPEWSTTYLLTLFVTSLPAAVNGAIGSGLAFRRGSLDPRPVIVLPVVLHVVVGLAAAVIEPQSLIGFQLYTLAFSAVIWTAGRLGQRIGSIFGSKGERGASAP